MKLVSVAGTAGARPTRGFMPYVNDAAAKELNLKKYESLLHKIAAGFGFSESETYDLIAQARAYARTHQPADCYPVRTWLSKIMVHTCTFRIGSRLFGQPGSSAGRNSNGSVGGFGYFRNTRERDLQAMPLSFRATYILSHSLGFTTQEVALILNTTPANVLERYNKALAFLGRGGRAFVVSCSSLRCSFFAAVRTRTTTVEGVWCYTLYDVCCTQEHRT